MLCAVERARSNGEAALCSLLLVGESCGRAAEGRGIDQVASWSKEGLRQERCRKSDVVGVRQSQDVFLRWKAGEDPLGSFGADFGQQQNTGVSKVFRPAPELEAVMMMGHKSGRATDQSGHPEQLGPAMKTKPW